MAHSKSAWIAVAPGAPYFVDEHGRDWTPIAQNDAITWPELAPLFRRRDLAAVEQHLHWLVEHGVTCLRLMIEYAQGRHRYLERPGGAVVPAMARLWDDLFAMCERTGLRILLTPVDTFWMWFRWRYHPWNSANGGPLADPARLLIDDKVRDTIKARLSFIVHRWGGSGALFGWDLWNEIKPEQAEGRADGFDAFIADLSRHVRGLERQLYGRSHPQTVSLFAPELTMHPDMPLAEPIFRHPDLDFASLHVYAKGPIDDPRDTVRPALAMARIIGEGLAEISDDRPFLDTEHGPIHAFMDRHRTLPEPFDDEYFRHMSWAHLASGGVGGGMRWPNRHPHVLTHGMRRAQQAMAGFLPLMRWQRFKRRAVEAEATGFHAMACGDDDQALVWLLRRGGRTSDGRVDPARVDAHTIVTIPQADGRYRVTGWDTTAGAAVGLTTATAQQGSMSFTAEGMAGDRAFAIQRID